MTTDCQCPEPHILYAGMINSGNRLLHELLNDYLPLLGVSAAQFIANHPVAQILVREDLGVPDISTIDCIDIQPLRCYFSILDVFRWPIEDLETYVARSTHVATHSPWNTFSAEVFDKFTHRIYIIRDPRDAALRTARIACTPAFRKHRPQPFDTVGEYIDYHLASLVRLWLRHVIDHVRNASASRIHFVFYEHMIDDERQFMEHLREYLGFTVDKAGIERRPAAADLGPAKGGATRNVFEGGWGEWREMLTNYQIKNVANIAGDVLGALGYPPTVEEALDWDSSSLNTEFLTGYLQPIA